MPKLIPLSRGQWAIVDNEDYEALMQFKWQAVHNNSPSGVFYAATHIKLDGGKRRQVRMHRLIMGAQQGEEVDHKNGNGLDNRKNNLRICSHSQNMANSNFRRSYFSSKHKGVAWHKNNGKWRVQIKYDGKVRHIGYFEDEIEAAKAYNEKALEYYGEFARLNKI